MPEPPLAPRLSSPPSTPFNLIAQGQMEIELYYADQLVPTAELARALAKRHD